MRIVFLGTPDFSVNCLKVLLDEGHDVCAVVTQPDKPNARGNVVNENPVKKFALSKNLKVLQYNKISSEGVCDLKELNPEIMVTAAYGQILSEEILGIAKFGVINVHASLLPKYRGAAPINWAIINGEKFSGVTIMKTVKELDAGDMICSDKIAISDTDTAGTLFEKLSVLGGECLVKALKLIESGNAEYIKQDESQATYYPILKKSDGKINFHLPVDKVCDFVRGMNPWPCAFTSHNDKILKIYEVEKVKEKNYFDAILKDESKICGKVIVDNKSVYIACNDGYIAVKRIQKESGKILSCKDFLNGYKIQTGDLFF